MFSPSKSHLFQRLCIHRSDYFPARSVSPAWKRLFNHALTTHERISAITMIFSDCNQVKIMRHLSGSDAQTFIDMIDEARSCKISSTIDSDVNLLALSTRRWMASHLRSAGGVFLVCTAFVAARPWFRDR